VTDTVIVSGRVRLVDSSRLHPEIGSVLPWDRTPEVIEDIRNRRLRGNAVLTVSN
jgi:hypothetical protein